jgi:hypothetical protein
MVTTPVFGSCPTQKQNLLWTILVEETNKVEESLVKRDRESDRWTSSSPNQLCK